MRYLTATGKIIEGETPLDVVLGLRNSSRLDAKLDLNDFMQVFRIRVQLDYNTIMAAQGLRQMLNELEEVGFLLRIE